MTKTTIICAIAILTAISAQANTITYTLTQQACTNGCGIPPFGTITLTDNGTGPGAFVSVIETLAANELYAGTGAGEALEFNVSGPVAIDGLTSGFTIGPLNDSSSAFGQFLESVTCSTCQGGQATNLPGPLLFNVSSTTGVTTASFIANGGGYFFASDIVGTTGNTGNVAAILPSDPAPVPEPGTLAMMLSGIALTGAGLIGKKRNAVL